MQKEKKYETDVQEASAEFLFGSSVTSASVFDENTGYGFRDEEYSEPAPDWQNGVYCPRNLTKNVPGAGYVTDDDGCLAIGSRVWTETERTGFGIYTYEDTSVFSVKLSPGDYHVEVTFVNPEENAYKAYIKAENIIKNSEIAVNPGTEEICSFTAVPVDGILDLKFLVQSEAVSEEEAGMQYVYVSRVKIEKAPFREKGKKPTIYLASDSTVQSYEKSEFPQTGWGQVLSLFFGEQTGERACAGCDYEQACVYETAEVIVENRSIGGRSSKSFVLEGKLDDLLDDIRQGDYLLIQWGHNDATPIRPNRYVAPSDFEPWLQYYVDGAKQRGAHPVLVTPVARYHFTRNEDGSLDSFQSDFEGYRQVMLKMAKEQKLALIDLTKRSIELCNQAGIAGAKHFFMQIKPGEYPDSVYRDGKEDTTHLQYYGAFQFAKCVAQGILESREDCLTELKRKVEIPEADREPRKPGQAGSAEGAEETAEQTENGLQEYDRKKHSEDSGNADAPSGFVCYEIDKNHSTGKAGFLVGFRGAEAAAVYRIYGKKDSEEEYVCVREFTAEEYRRDELGCCSMMGDMGHTYSYYMTCVNAEGTESAGSNAVELIL